MPELPEVETVVRGLRAVLPGRRIVSVRLGKTDFMDDPDAIAAGLPGARVASVERRGKFILARLEISANRANAAATAGPSYLIVHLGMTGRLMVQAADTPAVPHTHAFFALDDGRELRYVDARRFGRIALFSGPEFETAFVRLGIEPLEISEADFSRLLAGRRAMIKAVLLNQSVLRGIGNIYADESLWRAKIHPQRLGSRLGPADVHRLLGAIRHVLNEAIRAGGSTISDFANAEGLPGEFQIRHRAYDREGKRCFRCRAKIRRIIVAGRSSYFCPRCQPAPRARERAPKTARPARKKRKSSR